MKDKRLKIIIMTLGVILILCSLFFNPYVLFKTPYVGEFENLLYIKIYVIFLEVLIFLTGISFVRKSDKVIDRLKSLSPTNFTKKELTLLLSSLIFSLILLELIGRILFASTNDLPLSFTSKEMIYPALYNVKKKYNNINTNVLLLGGSVLYNNASLLNGLGRDKNIKFYNLAHPAHTSLDSLYKYRDLIKQEYKFDFVIFYHGINEVRTNNIQKEYFKEDYSHYYYYKLVNTVFKDENPVLKFFLSSTLVYNSYHLFCKIYGITGLKKNEFVPFDIPVPELTKFGNEIKSENSFRKNLLKIDLLAYSEKSILIVPFFAFHPFSPDQSMTKIWGEPKNVIKGIKRHNRVISDIKGRYITIDTSAINKNRDNFEDICHFTSKGNKIFYDLLIQTVSKLQITFKDNLK